MSARIRGEEVTLKVAVDGRVLEGSMLKVKDFKVTPRTDLNEEDYLGEQESDIDIQHHGFDLSWSVDQEDSVALDFFQDIIAREQAHTAHPDITITAIYVYRITGVRPKIVTFRGCYVKQNDDNAGGRKERVTASFEAKCKRRSVISP